MAMKKNRGFTLLEIMIIVAIIGVLAAIGIPNFLQAGRRTLKSTCLANLKLIDGAVQQAKFHYPKEEITMEVLTGPEKFIKTAPSCPSSNIEYVALDPPACPTLPAEHHL